ncbi:MAG TPA: phosphatase PAP2 family protein [Pyrinomonadaceae bacterium]|jgi:undecaprenyl-diphosphatase|nr:phosphatase PAP2 family protein [Pyrinomonadaceae bacterium]
MKTPSAKNFIWLPLLVGVVVFATMTFILDEISEAIVNHQPITITDVELSNWLHSHATPLLTKAMFVATFFGSTALATCVAIAFGLYLIRRRQFYWLVALMLSVPGGGLLNKLLKYIFQRPRPLFPDPLLTLSSYSFPSGHTMTATVLYGVIAAYLLSKTKNWRQRLLVVVLTGCLIVIVGFSRIYLGVHYLSDVLAAIGEGLAWLLLSLLAVYTLWQLRGETKKAG